MGFKDLMKNFGDSISKSLQVRKINNQLITEGTNIKRKVLLNLSLTELKNLSYLLGMGNLEVIHEYDFEKGPIKKKVKLDKLQYIEQIAKNPYSEICLKLRHMKKTSLADEIEREIDFLKKKANQNIKNLNENISGMEEGENDTILNEILERLIAEIISVKPEMRKNERDYQIELLGYLKGILPKVFKKQKVSLTTEYKLKTNKRLDILIQIDNYRIAIENKYNLSSSGSFQRAAGQVLEYSNFVDTVIIVQFEPLNNEVGVDNLKKIKDLIDKPLRVIANGIILA